MSSKLKIRDLNSSPIPKLPNIPYLSQDNSFYDWSPEARPYKELTRHLVAKSSGSDKKNLLALPGTTARDIQILKHYRVPAPNASWTLIERKFEYMQTLKENLTRLKLFTQREAIHFQQSNFNELRSKTPFDWAWFDLLGSLSFTDIFWLRDTFSITDDADVFFTLAYRHAARGRYASQSFFSILKKTLNDPTLVEELGLSQLLQEEISKLIRINPQLVSRSASMDHIILINYLIFKYIFNWKNFDCHCDVYMDLEQEAGSSEMLLFHLSNFTDSKEEFSGTQVIDRLIEIHNLWKSIHDDKEIAEDVKLSPKTIERWRSVNKLPPKSEAAEYQMSESYMALLQITDIKIPSITHSSEILRRQLLAFNPIIEKIPTIRITKIPNGIKIHSPSSRWRPQGSSYLIDINETISFELGTDNRQISLHPLFLHPFNSEGLDAIFRMLFVGDEYLHPQLCHFVDEECFELSPPQKLALQAWTTSFATHEKSGAIVLPTGTGKTVLAARIGEIWTNCVPNKHNTCRILFLAHQKEILDQTIRIFLKLTSFNLQDMGILYQTGDPKFQKYFGSLTREQNLQAKVVFASTQSLTQEDQDAALENQRFFMSLPENHFSLIVVDEFHHYKANIWQPLIEHFGGKKGAQYLLGLSATPFRGDTLNPMEIFEENYLYRMDLPRAIWNGYLTMPSWELLSDQTDYQSLMREIHAADPRISKERIKKMFSPSRIKAILETYYQRVRGKQTIVFCQNTKHARQMAEAFQNPKKFGLRDKPVTAEYLTAKTPRAERHQVIEAFKAKEIQIICVVGLFNEGIDIPNVEVLLLLRKTVSVVKAIQQLGRGLRLFPGKREVLILDFVGNYDKLNAIFNLANFTGININKISQQLTGQSFPQSEDFPIVPQINCKYGPGVKFVIKNITDRLMSEMDTKNRELAISWRKKHGLFIEEIAAKLGTTRSKVEKWLKGSPLKNNERTLIIAIKDLIDSGFNDTEIQNILKNFLKGFSYQNLRKKISE